jgi:hypothetical protein
MKRRSVRVSAITLPALLALVAASLPAAVLTVDSTSDAASLPDACTLRAAITAHNTGAAVGACAAGAGSANQIVLPAGATFTLASSLPEITGVAALTVEGNGAILERAPTLAPCESSGAELVAFFLGSAGFDLHLRHLTLRHGCAISASYNAAPAASAVTMRASGSGGAPLLHLEAERILENNARPLFGAAAPGAVAALNVNVRIEDSVFFGNRAKISPSGPGFGAGGAIAFVSQGPASRSLSIERSSFIGNRASRGGAVQLELGARDSVSITNSTFAGNRAEVRPGFVSQFHGRGAAIHFAVDTQGGTDVERITLRHNTIRDNVAELAAGAEIGGALDVFVALPSVSAEITWANNWLDANTPRHCGTSLTLPTYSQSTLFTNFASDATCGNGITVVPTGGMKPLADYGGSVPTSPPLPGSLAIDASAGCPLDTDARGAARPQDGDSVPGALCDVGAVEFVRNRAPMLTAPGALVSAVDTELPLGNSIAVADPDIRDELLELALRVSNGHLRLASAAGLTCATAPDPVLGNPSLVCRATLTDFAAALATLSYIPRSGFAGADVLDLRADDLGNGGDDDNPLGDARTVAIDVFALAPVVSLTPATHDFGEVPVGMAAAPRTTELRNTGTAVLTDVAIVPVPGDGFGASHDCAATLAPDTACTITLGFTPASAGAKLGAVLVQSNATGSPQVISLAGRGLAPASDALFADGFDD